MKKRTYWLGCVAVIFLLGAATTVLGASYNYIDITNPSSNKMPLAVPVFKSMTPTGEEKNLSSDGSKLLADTLDFTGYFKMIDPGAFLEQPSVTGIAAGDINFKNWTTIGADLLITGGVIVNGGMIDVELRLYDTVKQQVVVGKRYTGQIGDMRSIVRRFAAEVMFALTGSRGIFGSRIAFESTTTGNKEIFACDFDGYNPQQITHTGTITLSPAWSSDGKWLAYTSYLKGKPDLYIKNLAESRGAIMDRGSINISPAWVPGEFKLAASISFSGYSQIYLLTGDAKPLRKLTDSPGINVQPAFSPDGRQMAFVSDRAGSPQLFIKDLGSNQERRLTFSGRYNTSPNWSPKGDKIVYAAKDGGFNIHIINPDGSGDVQLTYNAGDNEDPSWSPDGSLIAFSSTREGVSRIYVMTAFGTEQRKLLTLPGVQKNPRWSLNMTQN